MLLSYWTVPYVSIDDRKIRGIYTLGLVLVLAYAISSIFLHNGFLEIDTVQGFARPSVKSPKQKSAEASARDFCSHLPCEDLDAEEAVLELGSQEAFVTTLVRELHQEANSGKFRTTNASASFVQGAEDFVVRVKHNANCPHFRRSCEEPRRCPYALHDDYMAGRLLAPDGRVLEELPVGQLPKWPLKRLLEAADLRFDDKSDTVEEDEEGELSKHGDMKLTTYRYKGFMLLIELQYDSTSSSFWKYITEHPPLTYEMRVHHVPLTTYKRRELHDATTLSDGRKQRTLMQRRGVLMRVTQSGRCGRYNSKSMLEKVLVNLGLMGVLTSGVEFLWQYVFPAMGGVDYNAKIFRSVSQKMD
eukprot:TRINITY_DN73543_c0_g1_i1.p1 TRINITY_DN73543_c0_g1~~TRINITY_DN73543_c0_g1_i1.p1  ORF type:complete len:372 (+),score=80.62 TRINITY_DN73543_c0_g1_i1:40-1116(+)